MFATRERLIRRQGASGTPRPEYLASLVSEYNSSVSVDRKRELVAHLANFAYDPINYAAMRELRTAALFISAASSDDETLRQFGTGGLCNIALDPVISSQIVREGGVSVLLTCARCGDTDTVLSAVAALDQLVSPLNMNLILTDDFRALLIDLSASECVRTRNLAAVVLSERFHIEHS